MEGRLDEAEKGYRYLSTLGVSRPNPDPNLALIRRDMGEPDVALPAWTKASLLEGADGFIWNQRGWAYVALGDYDEAQTAFRKALDVSTTSASQAEANLGIAMAAIRDSHPKAALQPLRDAWTQGPYLVPTSAYLTGLAKLRSGDEQAALENFGSGANLDPLNLENLRELAKLSQRVGSNLKAWHYFQDLLRLDPDDTDARARAGKVAEHIIGDPMQMLQVRRLSRPLLDPSGKGYPEPSHSSMTVRVALFASDDGKPAPAQRLYFMTNAPFRITTKAGEVVKESPTGMLQWEILFREETNIVEVRDTTRILQHTSKQPFRIEPASRFGSVLLKSAQFRDTSAIDPGDREVRGVVEVIPTPYGFILVNEAVMEDYLYGAVSAALPQGTPHEAYKAQAVVSRTRALWRRHHREPTLFDNDLCDSAHCQRFIGLNSETAKGTMAVAETEGMVLRFADGRMVDVIEHPHCGGITESGDHAWGPGFEHLRSVSDGPGAAPRIDSPEALERWIHTPPDRGRYCEQAALFPQVSARWIRVLDVKDLNERMARVRHIGAIRHLRALRRSPSGRVLALEVVGTQDSMVLRSPDLIAGFLSPGSLRSTLFTIQPLYKGSTPSHFILWGAGTGHGVGMCRAGAVGQASVGRPWHEILMHYFPGLRIWSPAAKSPDGRPAPANRKPRPAKRLNPRTRR
ncbi:MAG: SpoIID/LytB domain-containing protein [Elusimicrobia bacterium]|nr:SpoIID/LytB domain-containing protein [Elusimicrobiota bacterium]